EPFQDLSPTAACGPMVPTNVNYATTITTTVTQYVASVMAQGTAGGATANKMLKAQMLATALDAYFSDPTLGGDKIGSPLSGGIGDAVIDITGYASAFSMCGLVGSASIFDLLDCAANQSNAGGSIWYGQNKGLQTTAAAMFDAINNSHVSPP